MNEDTTHDEIRATVSAAYADAIERKSAASCCAPSCCGAATAAETVGYTPAQLEGVPDDVADSSFGCGSPLAFAGVQPGQTVVDLGSGAGLDLLVAAEAVGPGGRVIGVDMTPAMLERARANVARAGVTNVELREGIIESMPVDDASVDWVISNCVINLSPDKDAVFAEVARVLAPGGRVRVSDIVVEDLPDWIRARSDLFTACVGGAIGEAEYLDGMRRAGLVDVEVIARHTYGEDEVRAFLGSGELPVPDDQLQEIARALAGKVSSVKVSGRRP